MKFTRDTHGILFVVSAPSGGGKTSLCKAVIQRLPNFEHGISYTTRQRRPNEVAGKDYHFVSEAEFMRMVEADEFVEYAYVHGNYYGTSINSIAETLAKGKHLLIDIDVQGAKQIEERYGDEGIFIFILPPDFDLLRERLTDRQTDSEAEIERRLQKAEEEVRHYENYDYVVLNDDFSKAVNALEAIIVAEQCLPRRICLVEDDTEAACGDDE
ncbi:guanylate kinase [candidate division KSB3 bacterium]|uniref:Guanylate kinase n=1 Tax=candidate division KSB3 bacterium TaxID=2044937 RepID=A0A9D5Q693_9BACT|nr:guanylate kinase [candidate division KSB3 bacterium]MBD3325032.1 guanylate kinase [candidate division KSB3 bacterium]